MPKPGIECKLSLTPRELDLTRDSVYIVARMLAGLEYQEAVNKLHSKASEVHRLREYLETGYRPK